MALASQAIELEPLIAAGFESADARAWAAARPAETCRFARDVELYSNFWRASARLLALVIGAAGVILLGVVAAVTVQALNAAGRDNAE